MAARDRPLRDNNEADAEDDRVSCMPTSAALNEGDDVSRGPPVDAATSLGVRSTVTATEPSSGNGNSPTDTPGRSRGAVTNEGVDAAPRRGSSRGEKRSIVPTGDVDRERARQFAYAIASLKMYNPDFHLTPEVVEIMRVFFDDLEPDAQGTISVHALYEGIERLDPKKELISVETRQLIWRDITERCAQEHGDDARIDFQAFCAWVMRWKEISPATVKNVYTSWAKQVVVMDFGLNEGDGVFVLPAEEMPHGEELRFHLTELLRGRRRRGGMRERPSKKPVDREPSPAENSTGESTSRVTSDEPSDSVSPSTSIDQSSSASQDTPGDEDTLVKDDDTSEDDVGVINKSHDSMMTVSKSFIAGGAAGMIAKSLLAPVDRIKIMFQVNDSRHFSFRNAYKLAQEIYVQDGFRALFRGNMLNILRVVPYAGVQHSSFDFFRRRFHSYNYKQADKWGSSPSRDYSKLTNLQLIAAGSMAGGLSLTLSYPLDIVRARFMVQHGKHNYTSIYQAITEMYRLEGARSFSRGLVPSLLGTLPYTGIGFTLNEKFKHWMLELQQRRAGESDDAPVRLHPFAKLACSYFAACVAQTATYPMDTIRRRIQTDGFVTGNGKRGELRYTGVITTARIILTHEGWRGFFKGVSVNWMRSPLATGISLTAYDLLKEVMGVETVG